MVASSPKLFFGQMAAPVPEIADGSLHAISSLPSLTFTNGRSYTVFYSKFNLRSQYLDILAVDEKKAYK
jgi:hypothetical protein